jgi:uncharacterized protein YcbK (DUF882 family)
VAAGVRRLSYASLVRRSFLTCIAGAVLASSCARRAPAPLDPMAAPPPPVVVLVPEPPSSAPAVAWAGALPPLRFVNTRTGAECTVRLYAPDGSVDEEAASTVDRTLAERDAAPRPLHRRLLQLVVRAAAQFAGTHEVRVVSTFRDGAAPGSRHRSGEAIDFSLPGVPATKLAAFLRGGSRVGVGVYTHPRTQFVHLDVREQSYHWVDASPPGRRWRETRLTDRGALARDAAWTPEHDLPGSG